MKRPLLWSLAALIAAVLLTRAQLPAPVFLIVPALLVPLPLAFRVIRVSDVILVTGIYLLGVFTGFQAFGAAEALEPFFDKQPALGGVVVTAPVIKSGKTRFVLKTDGQNGLPRAKIQVQVSEELSELWAGDRLRLEGELRRPEGARNPGGFDYGLYLKGEGIEALLYAEGDGVAVLGRTGSPVLAPLRLGQWLGRRCDAYFSADQSSLIKGVLLGDKSMAEDLTEQFRDAGISHILAVSGLHVSYIYAMLLALMKLFRLRHALRPWVLLPCLLFYVILTGLSPSVIRAALMLSVLVFGQGLQENYDGLSGLCLAAIVILIASPAQLYAAGFQLSFLAVLGIILFNRPLLFQWERLTSKKPGFVINSLVMTCTATLATLPATLYHFYSVSAAGLVANLVIIPLVGFLIAAAALTLILIAFLPMAVLALPAAFLADLVLTLTQLFSRLGVLSLNRGALSAAELVLLVTGLFLTAGYFNLKRPLARGAVTAILGSCLLILASQPFVRTPLKITFLDVGQGDSALIETPSGAAYLIDGGGYEDLGFNSAQAAAQTPISEQVLLPALYAKNIRVLEGVFISHNHADHSQGIEELLGTFPVKHIYVSTKHNEVVALTAWGIPVTQLGQGDYLKTADGLGVEVLWPQGETEALSDDDQNEASLVLRLVYGKRSFLFTGDAGAETEAQLEATLPQADVLKVGHHGSKYSTSEEFLRKLAPSVAVISAGRYNTFGHPTPEVLERLGGIGAACLRTDTQGAVEMTTDGTGLRFKTWLP
ncbi:MAG: DNA internalization-related competence protein ComEC/Rec2 [Eubacterium sp.]|nr:DNA internalization-related competence protein ComEC/Rec2 [Eubacterium sp.]